MKRRFVIAAVAALTALAIGVGSGSAGSRQPAQAPGIGGEFSLIMMVHTSSGGFGDLPGVNPWNGARRSGGRFVYRSIPCAGMAPVNNISSDLPSYNTRVKGSRAPSSMRAHPMAFTVRKRDGRMQITGRIRFTVCQLKGGPTAPDDPVSDEQKPKIDVHFRADFKRTTDEALRWSGTFRLRGGTGRYEDLTGSGRIAGYFFCFAEDGCNALGGNYLDGQMVLEGKYRDPTPDLAG